jgi:transposase
VRRDGLRVSGSESEKVAKRIAELDLSDTLATELLPLFQILAPINDQIEAADKRIASLTKSDPEVALLTTAPSIGPITASAVVSTIDDIKRFDSAHQFEAFLGRCRERGAQARRDKWEELQRPGILAFVISSSKERGESSDQREKKQRRLDPGHFSSRLVAGSGSQLLL